MTSLRDLPNPSGADIEAFVNQRLAKLMQEAPAGKASFRAQDYDIQVTRAHEYPGNDWEYVHAINIGAGTVAIVWRISRVTQAQQGIEPIMKLITKKA